jgi:hypothetical protein
MSQGFDVVNGREMWISYTPQLPPNNAMNMVLLLRSINPINEASNQVDRPRNPGLTPLAWTSPIQRIVTSCLMGHRQGAQRMVIQRLTMLNL